MLVNTIIACPSLAKQNTGGDRFMKGTENKSPVKGFIFYLPYEVQEKCCDSMFII